MNRVFICMVATASLLATTAVAGEVGRLVSRSGQLVWEFYGSKRIIRFDRNDAATVVLQGRKNTMDFVVVSDRGKSCDRLYLFIDAPHHRYDVDVFGIGGCGEGRLSKFDEAAGELDFILPKGGIRISILGRTIAQSTSKTHPLPQRFGPAKRLDKIEIVKDTSAHSKRDFLIQFPVGQ